LDLPRGVKTFHLFSSSLKLDRLNSFVPHNKAKAESRKSEQPNQKHVAANIQMKIPYLSCFFVCLPTLRFQTKSKTKPDPRIVDSNRTREQLAVSSSHSAISISIEKMSS
jgi:hypothetical protein